MTTRTALQTAPARAARAGRAGLKRGIRAAGVLSAGARPLPDFLVIGSKRGGSTSFYYDLIEHPAILGLFPPPIPLLKPVGTKGVHYFDTEYAHGSTWYRSHFPTRWQRQRVSHRVGEPALAGEASPYYLFHPLAAARAHDLVPHAKIIAILRDPVMRTYSHWKERRREHAEDLDFLAALEAEPSRLAGERERLLHDPGYSSYAYEQQSYATQSRYAEMLAPWLELYGRGAVFVAASEDYYADPDAVLGDCQDFLGLSRRPTATGTTRNSAPGGSIDPAVRARLEAYFAEQNAALADLTGQRFPW